MFYHAQHHALRHSRVPVDWKPSLLRFVRNVDAGQNGDAGKIQMPERLGR